MRKVYGVKKLIAYLTSVDYPLTETDIHDHVLKKDIPHLSLINNMLVFDLDHIDWWIGQQRLKP